MSTLRSATACFHCGLPIPSGVDYIFLINGNSQPVCCRGCQAVAQAIIDAGLADFYRHRTQVSSRPEDLIPEPLRGLERYDRPDLPFVRHQGEREREAALILEGIVCAACVWLNERHVSALPGVLEFRINYSTRRAHLRWDSSQIKLSEILASIAAIGYQAHPFDPKRQEVLYQQERAMALRRLAVAGLGAMQVMMLAVALYAGDYYGMEQAMRGFLRWVSLVIALPVVLYSAQSFLSAAWRGLRRYQLGMDVPVSLAIIGALLASIWVTWQGGGEVYFDSVTMFTFFLLSGRFLEMGARHRAGQISEELVRLLPDTATRLGVDDGEEIVPLTELVIGDRVLIHPGETIPADGHVEEGSSSVDESLLSGESLPLEKSLGSVLIGGAINVESPLVMRVEQVGNETVLSAIVRLLDRAQSEKPRIAQLADRVAAWFVAALLLLAVGIAWWWWRQDPSLVLPITLSVLVVTCPCALSLATPTAVTAASGALTRCGLLITRGHALETLARATHVVFDKTGTLTQGRLSLTQVISLREQTEQHCLALAAALERGSEHPVAQALLDVATVSLPASELQNTPGQGVQGRIDGRLYRLGKAEFVTRLTDGNPYQFDADPAVMCVVLGDEQGPLACLQLRDVLRPDARDTVVALHDLGLKCQLLSGDRSETVAVVAQQVGIPAAQGGLLPEDKLQVIKKLQQQGAVVVMVGDGINDGPVLAAAQTSIAMGSGTQLAHASADMVLLSEHLNVLIWGIATARRTLTIIRQNLSWAIAYNSVALPLAAMGWVAPWMAALGMSLSSLLVVVNALRLKRLRATA